MVFGKLDCFQQLIFRGGNAKKAGRAADLERRIGG
jgi:hypothetical protein